MEPNFQPYAKPIVRAHTRTDRRPHRAHAQPNGVPNAIGVCKKRYGADSRLHLVV